MKPRLTISRKDSWKIPAAKRSWTITDTGNSRDDQRRSRENRSAKESKKQTRKPRSANPRRTITNAGAASRRYKPNPQPYSPATAFPIHRRERRTTADMRRTAERRSRTAAAARARSAAADQRRRRSLTRAPFTREARSQLWGKIGGFTLDTRSLGGDLGRLLVDVSQHPIP